MRTISTNRHLSARLLCLFIGAFIGTANATDLTFQFPNATHGTVCMKVTDRHFTGIARCDTEQRPLRIEKAVSKTLKASELTPIFAHDKKGQAQLIFLARVPSTPKRSTAFCGAGYEDWLLLVEEDAGYLKMRDRFLLQSCLKSLVLDSDQGDDPRDSIVLSTQPPGISFRWLGDEEGTKRIVTVKKSALEMVVDQLTSAQTPTHHADKHIYKP